MKLSALTITQNRLIWNSAAPPSAASCDGVAARPAGDGQDVHGGLGRLDEDREQTDDDREDAEAFGERGEDDRDAADLAGGIGVATDRRGGQAAQDADADARAEDAKGGESGA